MMGKDRQPFWQYAVNWCFHCVHVFHSVQNGYSCAGLQHLAKKKIAIIGAGPAGLTAAYLLSRQQGFDIQVFEKDPQYVGGISRTEQYKGFLFDIGGHRFFSKSQQVEDLWTEILGDELLERPRSSRIYYNKKFFSYPLIAKEALGKLGFMESAKCVLSYAKTKLAKNKPAQNFEEWVSRQFGERLYRIFFKTYTEKVWGMPCTEISADWAAQRIKGLSLSSAVKNALFPPRKNGDKSGVIKTLIDAFRYPRLGPGQMWDACRQKSEEAGVQLHMGHGVVKIHPQQNNQLLLENQLGRMFGPFDYVISSAPLRELVKGTNFPFAPKVIDAADALAYRDFITVVLIVKERHKFADNWIYIHDPEVKVGRIQNFKSWSPAMVPQDDLVAYGLEYFCFEGDGLWTMNDEELAQLGMKELLQIGLVEKDDLVDSCVVRQQKAYPVYDHSYQQNVSTIKEGLTALPNLIVVGRNGMHKYNNQDHSMMTAMLAVENIKAGKQVYDLWKVNQDAEYHEDFTPEEVEKGGRLVPRSH